MPVNVFALEKEVKNAEVSVKVEGPLSVSGDTKTTLQFQEPGDKLAKFALDATGEGMAKITVTAEGSGHKAVQTINVEVRNPNPATTEVTRITIGKGETRHLSSHPKVGPPLLNCRVSRLSISKEYSHSSGTTATTAASR